MSRLFEDPAYEQRLLDDLDRRYKRMENYRKQASNSDVGNLLNDHARRYPYVTPGVLEAMARAGVPADSQSAEQLAAASGEMQVQQGELSTTGKANASWFDRNVKGLGRSAVRSLTTVGHGILHETVSRPLIAAAEAGRPVRNLLGGGDDAAAAATETGGTFGGLLGEMGEQFQESYRRQGASPMVRAFKALRAGNGPRGLEDEQFLGAGFVPGGRIQDEFREQTETRTLENRQAIDVYGGDVSPGRAVASSFIEPGSTGFDTVSGMLDFAAGLFLDPTAKVGGAASKVSKARRTFGAEADLLPRTRKVLEGAQIVGPRKTTIASDVEDFLVRDVAGRRMVDDLVETTSPSDVWRKLGRKIDPQAANRIAKARTAEETREALRSTLGTSIREKPTAGLLSRGIGRVVNPEGGVYGVGAGMRHRYADGFRRNGRARLAARNRLLWADTPGSKIDVDDIGTAMREVEDFAKNALLSPEATRKHLDTLTEIDADDPARVSQVWNVARDLMKDVDASIQKRGKSSNLAGRLGKIVNDFDTEVRQYFVDELGRPGHFPGAKSRATVNGAEEVLPSAHLLTEYMNMHVPLPDGREIRQETSKLFDVLDRMHLRNATQVTADVLDHKFMRWWKPLQLLRGAWAVRVVGEEQARMGATGMHSAFNHPLSYVAWITGKRGDIDMTGNLIRQAQEHTDSMSRSSHWLGTDPPGTVRTGDYVRARKGDADFMRGWSDEITQLATDEVSQRVAGGLREGDRAGAGLQGLDAVKDWFWQSDYMRQLDQGPARGMLSQSRANADGYIDSVWARINIKTGGAAELRDATGRRIDAASATPDELADATWHITRTGDDELISGIGQGAVLDIPVHMTEPYQGMADEIGKALQTKANVAPDVVKVSRELKLQGGRGRRIALEDRYDRVIDTLYHHMMGKHTDNLSRSPVFKQKYWDEAERLLTSMSQEVQDQVFKNARKANLDRDTLARMARIVGDPERVGDVIVDSPGPVSRATVKPGQRVRASDRANVGTVKSLDEASGTARVHFVNKAEGTEATVTLQLGQLAPASGGVGATSGVELADDIAKAYALGETKRMLYDLSKRSQFADVTRLIFPFAEAFKEVMTNWARIGVQNPQSLERFRQVAMSGAFTEGPFGDEIFMYPGGDMPGLFGGVTGAAGGAMLGSIAGAPGAAAGAAIGGIGGALTGAAAEPDAPGQINMTGYATGLNLVTQSFVPGFGPVIQMPASALIPEKPAWQGVKDLILPYGRSGSSETGILESQFPAWLQRGWTALEADPEQDRIFANEVARMTGRLYSSGDYSDDNGMVGPDQRRRLVADATRHARWLYALRATAQFVLPTGPQTQFSADTPEGVITFQALSDEYRKMAEDEEAGGWETASDRFIERFGMENTLALQSKTKERRKRAIGESGVAWERNNPDLVDEFRNVIGWFAPEVEGEPIDYSAYTAQIARGDRETLTPDEQAQLHNHALGRAAMAKVDAELGDRNDAGARAYRRDMRQWLKQEYPGFDSTIAKPVREDRETIINEFNRAVKHPKLKDTELARGWREYMEAREEARERLPEGLTTFKGKGAAHLARYLRDYGQYLAHEYPGFGEVFDRILESELRDEDEEAA